MSKSSLPIRLQTIIFDLFEKKEISMILCHAKYPYDIGV